MENVESREREIKSLTGLRGIAACYVMLYHLMAGLENAGLAGSFLKHGYLSVDLFFILSGFVMALTYNNAFISKFSFLSYKKFLSNRLARIYPLYIIITLIVIIACWLGAIKESIPSGFTIFTNIFLIQQWGINDSIAGTTWSISTEFANYLLFPILVVIMLGSRKSLAWLATLLSLAILVIVATRTTASLHQIKNGLPIRSGLLDVAGSGTPYPLMRCSAEFVLGMMAFRLIHSPIVKRVVDWPPSADVILAFIVVLLFVPFSDIAVVLLFVPLIVTLTNEQSMAAKAMKSWPVYWLGLISYSIYLSHFLINDLLHQRLLTHMATLQLAHAYSLSGAILVLPILAISAVSYYGLEKPCRNWLRNIL